MRHEMRSWNVLQVNAVSKRPCRGIRSTAPRAGDRKCGTRKHETRAWQETTLPRACRASRRARETEQQHHRKFLDIDPRRWTWANERTDGRTNERTNERTNGRTNVCSARILRVALIKLNCTAFLRMWRSGSYAPSRIESPIYAPFLSQKYYCHIFYAFAYIQSLVISDQLCWIYSLQL